MGILAWIVGIVVAGAAAFFAMPSVRRYSKMKKM